jgi:hypothetical protein
MKLSSKLKNYLNQTLGYEIMLSDVDMSSLPFFIRKSFQVQSGTLCSRNVSFMLAQEYFFDKHSVLDIENILNQAREKLSCIPVFVVTSLSRQERLQLIKRLIPFIVPGTQMYLPELGIDFSEHIREVRDAKVEKLRPAAQSLLIVQLLTNRFQDNTLTAVAKNLRYATMSIVRAANELERLKLCKLNSTGNKKLIHFEQDNAPLWEKAKPYMRSPVKKRLPLLVDDGLAGLLPISGEYALSKHSNLSVIRKCYAVDKSTFKLLEKEKKIVLADVPDDGIGDLEIWAYNPGAIDDKIVDSLSLELSFTGTSDPRIKEALLNFKGDRTW